MFNRVRYYLYIFVFMGVFVYLFLFFPLPFDFLTLYGPSLHRTIIPLHHACIFVAFAFKCAKCISSKRRFSFISSYAVISACREAYYNNQIVSNINLRYKNVLTSSLAAVILSSKLACALLIVAILWS